MRWASVWMIWPEGMDLTAAHIRAYRATDRAACLALFDSNVPTFFAPDERTEFAAHLDQVNAGRSPYLVLFQGDKTLACGGISRTDDPTIASLSWGMVQQASQGQGLGRVLTQARLDLARRMPGVALLRLSTSQHTAPFYRRFGFAVEALTPDGFTPGLDRVEMSLTL